MNCETCKERQKQAEPVPNTVHESDMARMERNNRRMFILLLIAIAIIAVMTFLYVREKTSYETTEQTIEVDTGEGDAFVAGIGDVYYGESKGNDENPQA